MKPHTPEISDQLARQRVLEGMLSILQHLDLPQFKAVVEASEDTPDTVILEAMHQARLQHPGINRTQKQASKRWLERHGT